MTATEAGSGAAAPGAWAPLRNRIFLVIWLAVLVSSIGTWIRDVASGWLMTELSPSPLLVSLVQAATTLPVFLLSLPAGAIADIVDRRRLLIGVQTLMFAVAASLAIAAHLGLMTPALLLALIATGGVGVALAGPAFQAIVPELVRANELRPAVALNSLGVNIARAIGPALGGLIVATAGIATAYLVDALSYLFVIAAFLWWRPKAKPAGLPPEAFGPAVRSGLRYAMRSSDLKSVLGRAAAFFLFGSAYWALLPLIARQQFQGEAPFYGLLLASIGIGAVTGALVMPRLKLGANRFVLGGTVITAAVTAGLGLVTARWLAPPMLFVGGAAWIAVLTNLNVSAQAVLPNWVRARGLAIYLMTFFGATTVGSALWGTVAQALSVPSALVIAASGGALMGLIAARWVPLPAGSGDLTPSLHWPEPASVGPIPGDRGPVLISIAYDVDPADRSAFLAALEGLATIRRRDGAFGWRVLEDAEQPRRFEEIFFAVSWLEHLRQHQRVTVSDAALQAKVHAFHRGAEPPRVRHLLAASPDDAAPFEPVGDHRH